MSISAEAKSFFSSIALCIKLLDRIEQTPALQQYTDILLEDRPELEKHLQWALEAPVDELIDWCKAAL